MSNALTRRGFFGMSTAAAAGSAGLAAAPPAEGAESSKKDKEPAPRLFELGTVTFNIGRDWDLETLIKKCEQLWLLAVELRSTHKHGVEPEISKEKRKQVRRRFEDTPIKLFGVGSACEFQSPKAEVVKANIERTGKFIELAHDVGAQGVKVRPNGLPKGVSEKATLEQIGHALAECGKRAEPYGVEVWLEVHGRGTAEPQRIRKIMDACGHPAVGITWNSNAADVQDGSVRKSFELLKNDIRCVHIHDLYDDYPYRELFGLLREHGYARYTMVEMRGSPDVDRVMKYYLALWEELSRGPVSS